MSELKRRFRRLVPLETRAGVASWLGRNPWIPGASRWALGLVRDLETSDPKRYHKLLWEHHFDEYGRAYEARDLFAAGKLNGTVAAYRAFVEDLDLALTDVGMERADVTRVLDVGCSVGHVLRALELEVFQGPETLVGLDIDRVAIEAGRAYLGKTSSRIQLMCGDLEHLESLVKGDRFDFAYAAGSLSYLNEVDARQAVATVLGRTERLAAFVGLANPVEPNGNLRGSAFRPDHGSMWTHDFESMVRATGWKILRTRWQAPEGEDSQGLYSVFAAPEPLSETRSVLR